MDIRTALNILNQVGVRWLTSKLNTKLVIGNIQSTGYNFGADNRRRGSEAPLLVTIDNAQSRRATKIRPACPTSCVQRGGRGECEERKGKADYGRMHEIK